MSNMETDSSRHVAGVEIGQLDHDSSFSRYHSYLEQSAKFQQILTSNLMLVNSGALLVLPPLVSTIRKDPVDLTETLYAASFFVLGLIAAALYGMWLSMHYRFRAHTVILEWNDRMMRLDIRTSGGDATENVDARLKKKVHIKQYENLTFAAKLADAIFGLTSLAMFCAGCFYVRAALT